MKCLSLILFVFISIVNAVEFSGYVENADNLTFNDSSSVTSSILLRAEGRYKMEKGEVEAVILFSSDLTDKDMFYNVKEKALLRSIYSSFMQKNLKKLNEEQLKLMENLGTIERYNSLYSESDNEYLDIDRALVKLFFDKTDLIIGKQQIAWGTGYAFNPTDIWNNKNPLDAKAPKKGLSAINIEHELGKLSTINIIFAPEVNIENSSAGIRFKSNMFDYDYSLSFIRRQTSLRKDFGLDDELRFGFDLTGQVGELFGIWSEAVLVNPDGEEALLDSAFLQFDIGVDYTFDSGTYIMAEYLYNGAGSNDYKDYNTDALVKIINGDMTGFGMHYLFLNTNHIFFDDYTASLSLLANLSDGGISYMPEIEYMFNDEIILKLYGLIGSGSEKRSEAGGSCNSVGIKVTGYF